MRIYLQLPFARGNVTDSEHQQWIEILGFSFDFSHSTGENGMSSAKNNASRPHFSPLTINKKIDRTTPDIFLNAVSGAGANQATLDVCDNLGKRLQYRLTGVRVIDVVNNVAGEALMETIRLSYDSIIVWYQDRAEQGRLGLESEGGFDLVGNTEIY